MCEHSEAHRLAKLIFYCDPQVNSIMHIELTSKHIYQMYANQTLHWLGTDSLELWQKNMQDSERRAHLTKYGFDNPRAIVYQMNSRGFRCKEFDHTDGFIALGCSHTCGIGLPENQAWPSIVSQATGLTAWIVGLPLRRPGRPH